MPTAAGGEPSREVGDAEVGDAEVGVLVGRRSRAATAVRVVALLLVLVFATTTLRSAWGEVQAELGRLTVSALVAAALALTGALGLQFLGWFGLLRGPGPESGASFGVHDGAVVYAVGQLGKYVPGAVWPAVIQADMGARRNLPWRVMVGAYTQMVVLSVTTGAVVALATALGPVEAWLRVGVVAVAVAGVACSWAATHPDALHRAMDAVLVRVTGVGFPERLDRRRARLAAVASFGAWLLLGVHASAILWPLGLDAGDVPFVVGAFALAWVCGIVVVPVPAGLGVREAVLVLTVGALMGRPTAVTLALVSRLVQVTVDLGVAAVLGALVPVLGRRRRID